MPPAPPGRLSPAPARGDEGSGPWPEDITLRDATAKGVPVIAPESDPLVVIEGPARPPSQAPRSLTRVDDPPPPAPVGSYLAGAVAAGPATGGPSLAGGRMSAPLVGDAGPGPAAPIAMAGSPALEASLADATVADSAQPAPETTAQRRPSLGATRRRLGLLPAVHSAANRASEPAPARCDPEVLADTAGVSAAESEPGPTVGPIPPAPPQRAAEMPTPGVGLRPPLPARRSAVPAEPVSAAPAKPEPPASAEPRTAPVAFEAGGPRGEPDPTSHRMAPGGPISVDSVGRPPATTALEPTVAPPATAEPRIAPAASEAAGPPRVPDPTPHRPAPDRPMPVDSVAAPQSAAALPPVALPPPEAIARGGDARRSPDSPPGREPLAGPPSPASTDAAGGAPFAPEAARSRTGHEVADIVDGRAAARQTRPPPVAPGPGAPEPVPTAIKQAVHQRHGVDVRAVPVHRDEVAERLVALHGARALTRAGEVFLPAYHGPLDQPPAGPLLVHELTHVLQQRRLADGLPAEESTSGRHLEAEARSAASQWQRTGGLRAAPVAFGAPWARPAPADVSSAGPESGGGPTAAGPVAELEARAPVVSVVQDMSAALRSGPRVSGVQREDGSEGEGSGVTPTSGPGEPPPSPIPTTVEAPQPKAATTTATPTDRAAQPAPEVDLDLLARRLYPRVRAQLRAELLVDRERSGLLMDR